MFFWSSPFYEAAQPPPDKRPAVVSTAWRWQWTPVAPLWVWHCCSLALPIQLPSASWQSDCRDNKRINIIKIQINYTANYITGRVIWQNVEWNLKTFRPGMTYIRIFIFTANSSLLIIQQQQKPKSSGCCKSLKRNILNDRWLKHLLGCLQKQKQVH